MIINPEGPDEDDHNDPKFMNIYQEAMDLYGLIHARFITSQKGL